MMAKKVVIGCLSAIGVFTIVIVAIYVFTTVIDFNGNGDITATQTMAGTTTTPTQPTTPSPLTTTTATMTTEEPAMEIDILPAQITELIDVSACGCDSLNNIELNISSNYGYRLEVDVSPGTIFESQAAGVLSSMVVVKEAVIALEPNETDKTVSLDVASANMQLDVPGGSDVLELSYDFASGDLGKLLELAEFRDLEFRIQQFAVWTITDNPARSGYVAIGFGVGSQPSDQEMEVIQGVFEMAGIDIEKYWALQEAIYVEIIEAMDSGLIEVNACGAGSLEVIELSLTSLSDVSLQIAILPGIVFKAQSTSVQSMVVIAEEMVLLSPFETLESIEVNAACYNMQLGMPGESDVLTLEMTLVGGDLIKLLNLPDFQKETYRVQQFAIWTITDNPERGEYVGIGYWGMGSGPSDEELDRIRVLFEEAGITISNYQALV
jgi:hypothetical protein